MRHPQNRLGTRHSAVRVRLLRTKTQCIELYNVCTYEPSPPPCVCMLLLSLSLRYVMMMMVMGLADGFWALVQGSRVPVFRRKLFGMLAWLRAGERERDADAVLGQIA